MAEVSLQEYCEQIEDIIAQGRYTEAVAHGKHILKQYPKYVAAYRLLGRAMLEARQNEYAADMFRRVLSADPEDMLAWVAMSEVYDQSDDLSAALWCMERAFELSTDNKLVEEELRRLYGRRDGVESHRVQLTRGALARLYLKGDLLPRAVSELRALLAEHPQRGDVAVALAEALWRNEQRLEASEVCQEILDRQSYSLKANLILGEIWTNSGREEGQMYLRRAEALDPENRMAQGLFGAGSPLPAQDVRMTQLEYKPAVTGVERPDWMQGLEAVSAGGPPLTDREATLVDIAAGLEAQIEIPAWLEEIDLEEPAASMPPDFEMPSEPPYEDLVPAPAEEMASAPPPPASAEFPDWLQEIAPPGEAVEGKVVEEEAGPDLGPIEEGAEEMGEGAPEWLSGLDVEPIGEEEDAAVPGEELPDWLATVSAEPTGGEVAASDLPSERSPDWLADLRGQFAEEPPVPEPISPEVAPGETAAPAAMEEGVPEWLAGEGMPSGDEALAWLEQLAAGREGELLAQIEAESDERMAEIMGRSKPEEPSPAEAVVEEGESAPAEMPDWIQELAPPEAAVPDLAVPVAEAAPEETVAPVGEEAFGWTTFEEPETPPEVALPAEALPPTEAGPQDVPAPVAEEGAVPEWLEGEGMPSGDEALAWLEQLAVGKEEELLAQAKAESDERLAEILGRPKPEDLSVAEEVAALPVEEIAASTAEEAFGWTTFGEPETPPETVVAAEAPLAEEALPVKEEPVFPEAPEWVPPEEVEAPPVVELPPAGEPVLEAVPPSQEAHWGEALDTLLEEAGMPEEEVVVTETVKEAAVSPKPAAKSAVGQEPFAAERAYLKEHPRDYEARLSLARALWQAGEQEEALEAYSRVIRAGKFLDTIITELEGYLEQWPEVGTQRVLGDAYMKDGRLQDALDLYRQALETL